MQSRNNLVVFGAWFLGNVVAETAEILGWNILGFIDPSPPDHVVTLKSIPDDAAVIVAIGNNRLRADVQSQLADRGRRIVSIYHPTASISPSAVVGPGCYLAEFATIRSNSTVGDGTILNSGSVVSHDCQIGQFVTFGPNAAIAGRVSIGSETTIGVGANVRPLATVGSNCQVGAGAAVVDDVADGTVVVGIPAKTIASKKSPDKQSDWSQNSVW